MRISTFIIFSTAGAFLWSALLVYAGTVLGANWADIRHALQPFDLAIAVAVVLAVVLFVWWRLGMPGRPGRARTTEPPDADRAAAAPMPRRPIVSARLLLGRPDRLELPVHQQVVDDLEATGEVEREGGDSRHWRP